MNLDINSKDELQDLLAHCVVDIKFTCKLLFPDIFYAPFSILHQQIFDLINSGYKKIAIAAPRGIGKTSIARTVAMRSILFRLQKFIVYISNSATSAEMQTENIKRDLISNQQIRKLFGNVKDVINKDTGIDESFSKASWTAFGDTFILPRGSGQQVRGLNWANHRPELVIIDDLENKDEIRNEDNRKKLKDWFWSDLMKTEDRYSKGCIFIYIDTIKHEDSLLVDLLESPEWASIQLSICDDNYKSYDPNYMTDEEVMAEVEEHRRLGTLDAFYMERMNVPISKEDAVFKSGYFRYFQDNFSSLKVGEDEVKGSQLTHITLVDPARTVKLQSADSAVLTVAIDRTTRRIFVRDPFSGKVYPDELYDEMFRQVKLYGSFILGVDTVGLSNFVMQPLENECRIRGIHPMVIELPAKRSKEERVATLAPLYKQGYIYHNQINCGKLEGQLLGFPRSKLWDVMDCLAYITYVMDKHAIYFDPGDDLSNDVPDEEFDELYNEVMMTPSQMGHRV
jgi:hypothetical protein